MIWEFPKFRGYAILGVLIIRVGMPSQAGIRIPYAARNARM